MSIIDLESLGVNDEFHISRRVKYKGTKPMFTMVGNPSSNRKQISGMPLLHLILKFNADEQRFFTMLLDNRNAETNCADIRGPEITPTLKVKISKAYTSLKELDLVRRVSPGTYMINPKALIPPTTYEEAQSAWDKLK